MHCESFMQRKIFDRKYERRHIFVVDERDIFREHLLRNFVQQSNLFEKKKIVAKLSELSKAEHFFG